MKFMNFNKYSAIGVISTPPTRTRDNCSSGGGVKSVVVVIVVAVAGDVCKRILLLHYAMENRKMSPPYTHTHTPSNSCHTVADGTHRAYVYDPPPQQWWLLHESSSNVGVIGLRRVRVDHKRTTCEGNEWVSVTKWIITMTAQIWTNMCVCVCVCTEGSVLGKGERIE